jgi:hypothetical protein
MNTLLLSLFLFGVNTACFYAILHQKRQRKNILLWAIGLLVLLPFPYAATMQLLKPGAGENLILGLAYLESAVLFPVLLILAFWTKSKNDN